jgi:hypothetical protein
MDHFIGGRVIEPSEWLDVLGTGHRELRPFAAGKRKSDQRVRSPSVWHVELCYRQWDGPIGPWEEHFGKASKQVYPLDAGAPERSCNEVEVAKLMRAVREEAYWVSGYNASNIPGLWRPWVISPAERPVWLEELDRRLRPRIFAPRGGMPDVVAWDAAGPLESALFVECNGPTESVLEAQEDWVAAAIEDGVPAASFAAAIRVFGRR